MVERQIEAVETAVHQVDPADGECAPDHLGAIEAIRGLEIEVLVEGDSTPRPLERGSRRPVREPRIFGTKNGRVHGVVRREEKVQRLHDDGPLVVSIGRARMEDENATRGCPDQADVGKAGAGIRFQDDPAREPQAPPENQVAITPIRKTKADERFRERTAAEVPA